MPGHFERLTALQGRRNTYYSGSLLCFEMVHRTVQYAKWMVGKYF
jgi:hypothetical protein